MAELWGLLLLLGIVATPFLASYKGRSVVGWFFLGLFFNIFAFVVLAALPRKWPAAPHPLSRSTSQDAIEALWNAVPRVNRLQETCNNIIYDIEGTFVEFPTEGALAQAKVTYHRALAQREQAVNRLERATDRALIRAEPGRALAEALAAEDTMRSSLAALRTVEQQLFPDRTPSPLLEDLGHD